jgi:hypothetical protein
MRPMHLIIPTTAVVATLSGCPKQPTNSGPNLTPETLALPPAPNSVAAVRVDDGDKIHAWPALVTVISERHPMHLRLEDLNQGKVYEVLLNDEGPPASFGTAPGAAGPDTGMVHHDGSRITFDLMRPIAGDTEQPLDLIVDRSPSAVAPPDDWLAPGSVLYYGLTFDDKPITKVVPMALTVRLGAGSDGSRLLTWKADIDPNQEQEYTTDRTRSGRKLIPADVVSNGTRLDDRFARGEDISDANSLFLSHAQLDGVTRMGGASLHDEEVGPAGVLVRALALTVPVQADAAVWGIPSVAVWTAGGDAVYVVAEDTDEPLILSATRPGYTVRLMAIGRPAPRD